MDTEEIILEQEMRAGTYKFLSDCYHQPDEKLLNRLKSLDTSESELCILLAKHAPSINELELLKIDYSKLFIGPFKLLAPPYGSLYLEDKGTVMGNSTMDVKSSYQEEGLEVSLMEVPDHITAELEFIYFLIFKEIEAIKSSDGQMASLYRRKQKSFLETHLSAWVPEFTHLVLENAQTEFYKNLAQVTNVFVKEDFKLIIEK